MMITSIDHSLYTSMEYHLHRYYSNMPGLFKSREDFDAMKETMKTPLPVSIRINPSSPLWRDVANRCEVTSSPIARIGTPVVSVCTIIQELSKEPTQSAMGEDDDVDETVKKGMQSRALDW